MLPHYGNTTKQNEFNVTPLNRKTRIKWNELNVSPLQQWRDRLRPSEDTSSCRRSWSGVPPSECTGQRNARLNTATGLLCIHWDRDESIDMDHWKKTPFLGLQSPIYSQRYTICMRLIRTYTPESCILPNTSCLCPHMWCNSLGHNWWL